MNTTAKIALKIIPASLKTQPVFLRVDDTMVSKFGTKFENVSKLFDHYLCVISTYSSAKLNCFAGVNNFPEFFLFQLKNVCRL